MTPNQHKQPAWEKRLYEKFTNHGEFVYNKGSYPATLGEIKAFIDSERQLLLNEVRERVIGEDENDYQRIRGQHDWDRNAQARNQLRATQRTKLAGMEKR